MTRSELDQYYTPRWCVDQCLEHVLPVIGDAFENILEPGAGEGVFVDALAERYSESRIYAIDVDKDTGPWESAYVSTNNDFLSFNWYYDFDLTIGNPPYSLALPFVKRALEMSDNVVFLLRQGFLASQKRAAFFERNKPSHVFLIPKRPSFTADGGTDTADYCWVCWTAENTETRLHWLPVTERT